MIKLLCSLLSCFIVANRVLAQPPSSEVSTAPITKVRVERVDLEGNTVLSEAEWENAVKPFLNKEIPLDEIYQIRAKITDLYVSKGYKTSGAFIPPQEIRDGVIKVVAVEGSLERIEIKGLDRLNEEYVRSRLERVATTPLSMNRLEEGLEKLQRDPLIEQVQAELFQGTKPQQSVLELNLVEAPPVTTELRFGNAYSPSVGEFGGTAIATHQNFWGWGDRLSAQFDRTEGLERYQVGYAVPFNALDGTIGVNYTNADGEIIERPFTALDIQSEYESVQLSLRQPIYSSVREEFALGLSAERIHTESMVQGVSFPFTEGLEDGETTISALRFTQEWRKESQNQSLSAQSRISLGLDALGATDTERGIDSDFVAWQGQFQWVKAFNQERDLLVVSNLTAQLSPDTLLPIEQLTIGGLGSIRGYRQNQQIGDKGFVVSTEVRVPVFRGDWGSFQVVPFVDVGAVWNNDRDVIGENALASTGLGFRLQLGNFVEAQFNYGIPLVEVEEIGDSLQNEGGQFLIQVYPVRF